MGHWSCTLKQHILWLQCSIDLMHGVSLYPPQEILFRCCLNPHSWLIFVPWQYRMLQHLVSSVFWMPFKSPNRLFVVITTLWQRLHNYGKSPWIMGQLAISMAIFKSYVRHKGSHQPCGHDLPANPLPRSPKIVVNHQTMRPHGWYMKGPIKSSHSITKNVTQKMLYGSLCSIHGYPTSVVVCFIYIIRTIEILHILPALLHSLSGSLTLIDY